MHAKDDIMNQTVRLQEFGLDNFSMHSEPLKPLQHSEVRIQVKATSLNYRDLMVAKGIYSRNINFPLIPLSDGAGEVVEVGSQVTGFKVGDRVMPGFMPDWISGSVTPEVAQLALGAFVDGVLSRYFVWHEHGFVKIPDHLSFTEAATLPCAALTAWNALFEHGNVKPGDTILVLGSGGVSTFAIQFAVAAGARVIATTGSEGKIDHLKKLGACTVINYRREPEWSKAVNQATGHRGVDHVVEVGGVGTLEQSIKSVRMDGSISLIGVLSGPGQFDPRPLLMKSIRLQGIFVGSLEMFRHMNKAIEVNKIHPVIDRVFPIQEISDALIYLESGKHMGKIVVDV